MISAYSFLQNKLNAKIVRMSHSPEKRRADKEDALRKMAEQTEDLAIYTKHFAPDDDGFQDIFNTTWVELKSEYSIEEANFKGPIKYRLTGAGWIRGLRLTHLWTNEEFQEKAGKLSQTLTRHVKGEHKRTETPKTPVSFSQIVSESNLAQGFVYNSIESHLLRELFNRTDAEWNLPGVNYVLIPSNFGLALL